ncbi:MAG: serine acetyltransferase [bacterium]|nr:serine acetyltransferase [bacterium]
MDEYNVLKESIQAAHAIRIPEQFRDKSGCVYPNFLDVQSALHSLRKALFADTFQLQSECDDRLESVHKFMSTFVQDPSARQSFYHQLPIIKSVLLKDAEAIYKGDPAAASMTEIILCYPGFWGIFVHRVAHELFKLKVPLIPRMMSEVVHSETGIDIHPGASIDAYFCIDHGTGIVIGETTVIGKWVKLYQGVTLGALSVPERGDLNKRHPTLKDGVTVYAGTTILGGRTIIGENTIIGGNVWLTESVAAGSKIYKHVGDQVVKPSKDDESNYQI